MKLWLWIDQVCGIAVCGANSIKSRNESVILGAERIASSLARRNEPYGCPECMEENLAATPNILPEAAVCFRLHWALKCVMTCGRHRRPLVPVGTRCDNRYNRYDMALMADGLAEKLPALLAESTRRDASGFEVYACQRIYGVTNHGNPLDALALNEVISLCRALGMVAIQRQPGKVFRPGVWDAEVREALIIGFDTLTGGREGLRDFFFDHISNRLGRIPLGPQALLGKAYGLILSERAEKYQPIASMIANAIYDSFPYGPEDHPIAGVPITHRRWYTPAKAYSVFGVSPQTVISIANTLGFAKILVPPSKHSRGVIWLNATKCEEIFGHGLDFGWKLGLTRLGLSPNAIRAVVADDLLETITPYGMVGNHGVSPVRQHAPAELVDKFAQNAHAIAKATSDCVPLYRAAMTVDGMRAVHKAVLGRKTWVGKLPSPNGRPYESLQVLRREIAELLTSQEYVTFKSLLKGTGLNKSALTDLIRSGHVPHQYVTDIRTGLTVAVFEHGVADAIREQFAYLTKLTNNLSQAKKLRARLEAAGIRPVSVTGHPRTPTRVYRISDVREFI